MSDLSIAMERKTEALPGGWAVWLIALVTVGLCVGFALDVTPWLRGPEGTFEWRWNYHPFGLIGWRLIPVAVLTGLLAGWYRLAGRQARVSGWLLAALVPLALALQLTVLSTGSKGLELVARVLNRGYFGYYPPSTKIEDMADFIDHYAENQPTFANIHLQVHPPGNVVFLWTVYRAVKAVPALTNLATPHITPRLDGLPDWIADYSMTEITGAMVVSVLIPLIAGLAVVPLSLLARDAFGEEVARRAAVLFVLAPGLTLLQPKMNEPYMLLSALAFWLAYRGVKRDRLPGIYLSGLACSVAIFMSYSNVLLPPAVGLFVLAGSLAGWRDDRGNVARRLAERLLTFGAGVFSVQVFMALAFGWDQIRSIEIMLDINPIYDADRNYWYNLFYTPYSMLLFAGIPVGLLLLARVARLTRASLRRESLASVNWFLIGTIITVGAVMLSGNQRGENERVFMYFMPATILFGAAESERLGMGRRSFVVLAALTFAQLMVFQAFLEVYL